VSCNHYARKEWLGACGNLSGSCLKIQSLTDRKIRFCPTILHVHKSLDRIDQEILATPATAAAIVTLLSVNASRAAAPPAETKQSTLLSLHVKLTP